MDAWLTHASAYWLACGPVLVPIAGVCLMLVGFLIRSRALLNRLLATGGALQRQLRTWPEASLEQIYHHLAEQSSPLAAILAQGLAATQAGQPVKTAAAASSAQASSALAQDFGWIAVLTTIAPLLGLLGTVMGMVQTFAAVGHAAATAQIADGISQALLTTQVGLVVALIGLCGLARLRRLHRQACALIDGSWQLLFDLLPKAP